MGIFLVAGAGLEPRDLRVMSPTSYLTAPPRIMPLLYPIFFYFVNRLCTLCPPPFIPPPVFSPIFPVFRTDKVDSYNYISHFSAHFFMSFYFYIFPVKRGYYNKFRAVHVVIFPLKPRFWRQIGLFWT